MMRARDACWLAAGAASALLVQLLPGSVAFFDAGELATAAATLGVPHPTGFPLLNLAGHAAATLLPLGDRAFRIHLVSLAFAMAATTLALAVLWRAVARSRPSAVALGLGALYVLGAPTLLLHATAVEVYALVWFVVAASAAALASPRVRVAAAYPLIGLAALVHVEAGLFAVAGGIAGLWTGRRRWGGRRLGGAALAVVLAVGIVYLPLASARSPHLDWGVVRSVDALWAHLTAASIRGAFSAEIGGGPEAFTLLGRLVWREVGLGLVAAMVGLAVLAERRRAAAAVVALIVALDLAYAGLINPMGLVDDQVGQVAIGALRCLGVVGLVVAATALARRLPGLATGRRAAAWATAGLVLSAWWPTSSAAPRTHPLIDARGRAAAADVADQWLDGAPPGAWLVASGDQRASACLWLQADAGRRPDVRCLPGVFARDPALLEGLARRWSSEALLRVVGELRGGRVEPSGWTGAWLEAASHEGPVLTSPGLAEIDRQARGKTRHGLPWATWQGDATAAGSAAQQLAAMRAWLIERCGRARIAPACTPGAPFAKLLGIELGVIGTSWLRDAPAPAREALSIAHSLAPHAPRVLHNLAVVALADGDLAAARALAVRALDEDPTYHRAHRVAARAAARQGELSAGLRHALAWAGRAEPAAQRAFIAGWLARDVPPERRAEVAHALAAAGAWSPGPTSR